MRKGRLTTLKGNVIDINIPESAKDIPLRLFIPARVILERIDVSFNKRKYDELRFLKEVTQFLSFILEVPFNDLLGIKTGTMQEAIYALKGNVDWEHVDTTLLRLYTYIADILAMKDVEDVGAVRFEYKGDKWFVPEYFGNIDIYNGSYEDLFAWQVVEIMELQRQVNKVIDLTYPIDSNGLRISPDEVSDDNLQKYADAIFEQYIKIVAVLVRDEKVRQLYDLGQDEIDKLIEARAKYFIDIDTETAFRVFFYGLNMSALFTSNIRILISSINRQDGNPRHRKA